MGICLRKVALILTLVIPTMARADEPPKAVISELNLLRELGLPVVFAKEKLGLGVALVNDQQKEMISERAHQLRRCGGFKEIMVDQSLGKAGYEKEFAPIGLNIARNKRLGGLFSTAAGGTPIQLTENADIKTAVQLVDTSEMQNWVKWFSNFHTRFHNLSTANDHANALKTELENFLKNTNLKYSVELVTHSKTQQRSLRVRVPGAIRPNEVVIVGGHYDSIHVERDLFGLRPRIVPRARAPGADDNASGSAAILEALRVFAENGVQPERTVEFIWYAAEEVGLYGSQEIAKDYKRRKVDVIAVMQLDMVLYPGNGELTLTSISDYTSPWLRSLFLELNRLYIGGKVISSKCGYACSDHASWHDAGFPTVFPTESGFRDANPDIHSDKDVINGFSNFKHASAFAKGALAFVMELGNSTLRE